MILKELLTTSDFQRNFFKNIPTDFNWQDKPLQVYPLSFVAKYLVTPLPLFQSANNYIIHIKSGSISQIIGKDHYKIQAPALIVALHGSVQALQSITEDAKGHIILIENITMSVMFNNEDLLNLFVVEPVMSLTTTESEWIHTINSLLYKEVAKEHPNRKIAEGLLQAQLYNILELSSRHRPLSREQQIAIAFKQLAYQHYISNKSVSFYANSLHISENYLNRCVKTTFKKTSKEVIIEIVVLHGQLLLWNMKKSIAEVSYELNMEDSSYFSRIFKKITGLTPTEYRNEIMGNYVE